MNKRANVYGRLHDSRHTLITELAEGGVGDQTMMDIAGHVSRKMLKHYSHVRMQAKREALESVVQSASPKTPASAREVPHGDPAISKAQEIEGESPQKPLHSNAEATASRKKKNSKPLKDLAPRVGFEPTTLRLTAEIQGEPMRRRASALYQVQQDSPNVRAWRRKLLKKSSYKESYTSRSLLREQSSPPRLDLWIQPTRR